MVERDRTHQVATGELRVHLGTAEDPDDAGIERHERGIVVQPAGCLHGLDHEADVAQGGESEQSLERRRRRDAAASHPQPEAVRAGDECRLGRPMPTGRATSDVRSRANPTRPSAPTSATARTP